MSESLEWALSPDVFAFEQDAATLAAALGTKWPRKVTWFPTVDTRTSERVVCGAKAGVTFGENTVGLRTIDYSRAVCASCAVPGVWPAQEVGVRMLVDGGVRSATNADLAIASAATHVLVSAPLAFRDIEWQKVRVTNAALHATRLIPQNALDRELREVRTAGIAVRCVTPSTHDLQVYGKVALQRRPLIEVAEQARESTINLLHEDSSLVELFREISNEGDLR